MIYLPDSLVQAIYLEESIRILNDNDPTYSLIVSFITDPGDPNITLTPSNLTLVKITENEFGFTGPSSMKNYQLSAWEAFIEEYFPRLYLTRVSPNRLGGIHKRYFSDLLTAIFICMDIRMDLSKMLIQKMPLAQRTLEYIKQYPNEYQIYALQVYGEAPKLVMGKTGIFREFYGPELDPELEKLFNNNHLRTRDDSNDVYFCTLEDLKDRYTHSPLRDLDLKPSNKTDATRFVSEFCYIAESTNPIKLLTWQSMIDDQPKGELIDLVLGAALRECQKLKEAQL